MIQDIDWIRSISSLPIILKGKSIPTYLSPQESFSFTNAGIQRGDDAIMAVKHNVPAIILSNHGGRQLDFARFDLFICNINRN
jgi:3-deoxy-D-arabino-heptulosonate 7-phosphate (DAHP) synthase